MSGTSFLKLIFYILFSLSTSNSETSCLNEEQCFDKHNKYSKGIKMFHNNKFSYAKLCNHYNRKLCCDLLLGLSSYLILLFFIYVRYKSFQSTHQIRETCQSISHYIIYKKKLLPQVILDFGGPTVTIWALDDEVPGRTSLGKILF